MPIYSYIDIQFCIDILSHLLWALVTETLTHWLEPLKRGKDLVLNLTYFQMSHDVYQMGLINGQRRLMD